MATKDEVRALLERYTSAMNERRREDWLDCFADDAVQEDPVGAPVNVGREALGRFFDEASTDVTLTVADDPIVLGDEVVAFLTVEVVLGERRYRLPRIVDHIVLTDDGARFRSLRAFFDPTELVPVDG
jgi:steroid delta-isomerase